MSKKCYSNHLADKGTNSMKEWMNEEEYISCWLPNLSRLSSWYRRKFVASFIAEAIICYGQKGRLYVLSEKATDLNGRLVSAGQCDGDGCACSCRIRGESKRGGEDGMNWFIR